VRKRERHIVGIDLAGDPRRTGVVELLVSGENAVARVPDLELATDDALTSLVGAETVVGVDAPLGWPDDFVEAVGRHAHFQPWPEPRDPGEGNGREHLRLRCTDRAVADMKLGSIPLSVSSDLIGVVAMRAARLQSLWALRWERLEARDGSGRLIETYPAVALRYWGLIPPRGVRYKGAGNASQQLVFRAERERLLGELLRESSGWLEVTDELVERALQSDHVLDALVCALVSLFVVLGKTKRPRDEFVDVARREGWIHVPTVSLKEVGALLEGL